ncbi:SDR family oxidoreductase [Aidingimonas lacisalsi]|uniref:SDR family oxidoreductase n=1 Tax=Aidingimonas lacisalsi TaxID=2604086 RepID=UPI0011D271B5|nr:SDR family oxidoreductase [Aidingimonas lacisalsi]
MSALFDLTGKTALVTGSSGGLGFAMAQGLAEAGAEVILHGRNQAKLDEAVSELRDAGLAADSVSFDITQETSIESAFKDFDAAHRQIDILVNNAGMQWRKPMTELALEDWQKVIDTNLTSAFLMGKQAARRMIQRGDGGKIINIGSLTSQVARATVAPYTAAKGGIRLLTCSMAAEWAQYGIQSNAIGPGYMLTEMTQPLANDPDFDGWVRKRSPSGRWGTPEDLVGTVVYLAAPASNYVNGQIVYVDGGMLAVL